MTSRCTASAMWVGVLAVDVEATLAGWYEDVLDVDRSVLLADQDLFSPHPAIARWLEEHPRPALGDVSILVDLKADDIARLRKILQHGCELHEVEQLLAIEFEWLEEIIVKRKSEFMFGLDSFEMTSELLAVTPEEVLVELIARDLDRRSAA